MKAKQKGVTIIELVVFVATLGCIGVGGYLVYALIHFIGKYW